jgi:hypothetical protein
VEAFFDVHLDPACDPTAHERALFELLGELWAQLHAFGTSMGEDAVLRTIVAHLQSQLVGAALVLSIKVTMTDANEQE